MGDFDIFDEFDNTTNDAQLFLVDYQSRLKEEKEVPSSEPVDVDPVKLSTAWAKAVDNIVKDTDLFMSHLKELYWDNSRLYWDNLKKPSSFTGYTRGQLPSSPFMFRTHPSGMISSSLTDLYPIQPDTGTKD